MSTPAVKDALGGLSATRPGYVILLAPSLPLQLKDPRVKADFWQSTCAWAAPVTGHTLSHTQGQKQSLSQEHRVPGPYRRGRGHRDAAGTHSTRLTCLSIRVAPWCQGSRHLLGSGIGGIKKEGVCHGLHGRDCAGCWAPLHQPSPRSDRLFYVDS